MRDLSLGAERVDGQFDHLPRFITWRHLVPKEIETMVERSSTLIL